MRTTIEMTDAHRAALLELAARRGLKGFSSLVEDAIASYLLEESARNDKRRAAARLRGTLSKDDASALSARAADLPRSPNPFAAEPGASVASPSRSAVELTIHDVLGRRVRTLLAGSVEGVHAIRWDGRDEDGRPLASGVYFVRLARDGGAASRQVVLAR